MCVLGQGEEPEVSSVALARLRYICAQVFAFSLLVLDRTAGPRGGLTATTRGVPVGDALCNRVEHTGMRVEPW